MRDILILTDFANFDPGYSLCYVVQAQIKMLRMMGIEPTLAVRQGFDHASDFYSTHVEILDPGDNIGNEVVITEHSEAEIQRLEDQLAQIVTENTTVITHDIIYQPSAWKYRVAYHRLAQRVPAIRWLHFIHSSAAWDIRPSMGRYAQEVAGPLPSATLAIFSPEEEARKLAHFAAEKTAVCPNPIDVLEGLSSEATQLIQGAGLLEAQVAAILPARLDPDKQVDIAAEIMSYIPDARLLVLDFHSADQTKARVREQIKRLYQNTFFASEITGKWYYHRSVVLELMQFCDLLIHPSKSEGDSLVVKEAARAGCMLLLNRDLPAFYQNYVGLAHFGQFSSKVDVITGLSGETSTNYHDRGGYMRSMAMQILAEAAHNKVVAAKIKMRKQYSLQALARQFVATVEAA